MADVEKPLTAEELKYARILLEKDKIAKAKAKEYAEQLKKDPRKMTLLQEKGKFAAMKTKLLIAKAVGKGLAVSDEEVKEYMRKNNIVFKEYKI
jgi:predicted protein tyrosine phosphatase